MRKQISISVMIAVLVLSLIPGLAIAKGSPSMSNGNSVVVIDAIGDFLPGATEYPAYADIKKTQIVYQAGRDTLVFIMNLAGVIPLAPPDDDLPNNLIIYNWMLDFDLDGEADGLVSASWTDADEWEAGVKEPGPGDFIAEIPVVLAVNGSRIEVSVGLETIDEYFGQIITEFNWRSVTKYLGGQGSTWDVAPDGSWAYWSR
jgi:hypothetical protein